MSIDAVVVVDVVVDIVDIVVDVLDIVAAVSDFCGFVFFNFCLDGSEHCDMACSSLFIICDDPGSHNIL